MYAYYLNLSTFSDNNLVNNEKKNSKHTYNYAYYKLNWKTFLGN